MKETNMSGTPDIHTKLNEGNPNTERTPIQERQPTDLNRRYCTKQFYR